jgi:hypothetical protein
VKENGGNDFQIFFYLIEDVMLIKDYSPGLNPSRNR